MAHAVTLPRAQARCTLAPAIKLLGALAPYAFAPAINVLLVAVRPAPPLGESWFST